MNINPSVLLDNSHHYCLLRTYDYTSSDRLTCAHASKTLIQYLIRNMHSKKRKINETLATTVVLEYILSTSLTLPSSGLDYTSETIALHSQKTTNFTKTASKSTCRFVTNCLNPFWVHRWGSRYQSCLFLNQNLLLCAPQSLAILFACAPQVITATLREKAKGLNAPLSIDGSGSGVSQTAYGTKQITSTSFK